jgi:alpha-glucosidase (family GH31 glycosyl hydrolase)
MTTGLWGIPMVGADICGFFDDTTPELCTRWIQTGAFHPFSRVHNGLEYAPQELYRWDSVAAVARKVYGLRYAMLPYIYTVMHEATVSGVPIIRPLLMEFPNDQSAYDVELQFMVGNSIMVSPITDGDTTEIDVYFPAGKWYDMFNYSETINCMPRGGRGCSERIHTPLEETNVHIHGGNIIPLRETSLTTVESRTKNFELLVALDQNMNAEGSLFHDDGEQVDLTHVTMVDYNAKTDNDNKELKITGKVAKNGYDKAQNKDENFEYNIITVLGVSMKPTEIILNGKTLATDKFTFSDDGKLEVTVDNIKVYNDFDLAIKF